MRQSYRDCLAHPSLGHGLQHNSIDIELIGEEISGSSDHALSCRERSNRSHLELLLPANVDAGSKAI